MIKKLRDIIVYVTVFVIVVSNTVNYFYFYKVLQDPILQWRVAMISIAFTMFALMAYCYINEKIKLNKIKSLLTGWAALYLFVNFIGVCCGANLHTKGFMMILFTIALIGGAHLVIGLWRNLS